MLYIHKTSCISPQQNLSEKLSEVLKLSSENKLYTSDTGIDEIPINMLRRMGKAVKMGIGAGMPLLKQTTVNGIIIGTGNGGLEDCIKFLNQITDYNEGRLTPTNFVQSTTNAIASQLGMMSRNNGYNITHVHRGLAFENAVIDTGMLLQEHRSHAYLLGGVDEISDYNYVIENLNGLYKKEIVGNNELYRFKSEGTIAGEGAAMFIASNKEEGAILKIEAVQIIHTNDIEKISVALYSFLLKHETPAMPINLMLSGENGDNCLTPFYSICENLINKEASVLRFKHMTGEFPSASALALNLICQGIQNRYFPTHMYKKRRSELLNKFLIYNTYKGEQHSFMLLSRV